MIELMISWLNFKKFYRCIILGVYNYLFSKNMWPLFLNADIHFLKTIENSMFNINLHGWNISRENVHLPKNVSLFECIFNQLPKLLLRVKCAFFLSNNGPKAQLYSFNSFLIQKNWFFYKFIIQSRKLWALSYTRCLIMDV